jgi:hypothetical protein
MSRVALHSIAAIGLRAPAATQPALGTAETIGSSWVPAGIRTVRPSAIAARCCCADAITLRAAVTGKQALELSRALVAS